MQIELRARRGEIGNAKTKQRPDSAGTAEGMRKKQGIALQEVSEADKGPDSKLGKQLSD